MALDNFSGATKKSGNLLFLDEVDGIAGNEDRGGVSAIIKIVEESLVPVIMAANDPDIEKLRPLKESVLACAFSAGSHSTNNCSFAENLSAGACKSGV